MLRQQRWINKQKAAGNCVICGKPRQSNRCYCDRCNDVRADRRRAKYAREKK